MSHHLTPTESANTEDLAVTEYDAERRARLVGDRRTDAAVGLPTDDEARHVGLSQKIDGAEAVVKPETEI